MPAGQAPAEGAGQPRVPGPRPSSSARCSAVVPDSCVARNAEPICTPSAPRASAAAMPRASAMPPAAMTGARTSAATIGDERQRPDERVLGRAQERAAMPARLGARRDDDVDAGLVERDGLVGRRRGPERDDPALAERLEQRAASGTPKTKLNAAGPCLEAPPRPAPRSSARSARGTPATRHRPRRRAAAAGRPRRRSARGVISASGRSWFETQRFSANGPASRRAASSATAAIAAGSRWWTPNEPEAAGVGDGGGERDARQAAAERALGRSDGEAPGDRSLESAASRGLLKSWSMAVTIGNQTGATPATASGHLVTRYHRGSGTFDSDGGLGQVPPQLASRPRRTTAR